MKIIVKFIYTILLPLTMIGLSILVFMQEKDILVEIIVLATTIACIVQSFFWFTFMERTKMTPRVKLYTGKNILLGLSFPDRKQVVVSIIFMSLLFDWSRKNKKSYYS